MMIAETDSIRSQWDDAAEGWDGQEPVVRQWLRDATEAMFGMAGLAEGQRVLDVAAGAGGQTLDIAARVGASGRVLATDLAAELIAHLRRRAAGASVEARVADAEEALPEAAHFDAAVCRMGLMLMAHPDRCLTAVRQALKPGGRFCAMVFDGPESNPCIRILMGTALRHAGRPARDPFAAGGLLSLGGPGRLDGMFRAAGFREVETVAVDAPFRLARVEDYVAFVKAAAAPVRAVLGDLPEAARAAAWQDMADQLAVFQGKDGWVGPNRLLLTAGSR
jgi:ubiquinone/menaquinone biosynthesis C-methylase UbiE